MTSIRNRWVCGVGAVVLVSGLLVPNIVTAGNPTEISLAQISDKLDQVLAKLNSGGSNSGNHTQRWDQALPAAQRFVVLVAFNNAGVLDNNTGLVWEQMPATTKRNFQDSTYACANKNVGGQKGWRLPSIPELASLIDSSVAPSSPTLPTGHPFTNVQSEGYWSASEHSVTPSTAWVAFFGQVVGGPPLAGDLGSDNKGSGSHYAWCVRGGMNEARY